MIAQYNFKIELRKSIFLRRLGYKPQNPVRREDNWNNKINYNNYNNIIKNNKLME